MFTKIRIRLLSMLLTIAVIPMAFCGNASAALSLDQSATKPLDAEEIAVLSERQTKQQDVLDICSGDNGGDAVLAGIGTFFVVLFLLGVLSGAANPDDE